LWVVLIEVPLNFIKKFDIKAEPTATKFMNDHVFSNIFSKISHIKDKLWYIFKVFSF